MQRPDLDTLWQQHWHSLLDGVKRGRHPYHIFVLATSQPSACNVVLRVVDTDAHEIMCHTDVRSEKFKWLSDHPEAAAVFYHREERTQLRLKANVICHQHDDLARARWADSSIDSRQCYRQVVQPGSHNDVTALNDLDKTSEADAFQHFGVLVFQVHTFEALTLSHEGHQRARWQRHSQTDQWEASWVAV